MYSNLLSVQALQSRLYHMSHSALQQQLSRLNGSDSDCHPGWAAHTFCGWLRIALYCEQLQLRESGWLLLAACIFM